MTPTQVVNRRTVQEDVYIGRGSKWGNPYTHKPGISGTTLVESRAAAVEAYRKYLYSNPELMAALPELRGKRLGCYCAPKACHGDVLIEALNELHPNTNEGDRMDNRKTVAFTGSRTWTNTDVPRAVIEALPDDTHFSLGDAKGLDTIAKNICVELGRHGVVKIAHWDRLGLAAGPERNGRMLDELKPRSEVHAFSDDFTNSKGTRNCIKQALQRNHKVFLHNSKGQSRRVWLNEL